MSRIKGLTVEIGAETTGLQAALKDVGKASNEINKELAAVERGLKFDPSNTVLLGQKQELLEKKVSETRKALDALRQAQERVEAMYAAGEIDDGEYRAFRREIETTESKLRTFEGQIREVDQAQEGAGRSAGGWGDKLKGAAGALGAAGAAAGTALVAMTGQAVVAAGGVQDLATKTGLSAERIQELAFAGANLGVEVETIAGAQAKLTRSMDQSREGAGQQAAAFDALGISVLDSNGELRDSRVVMLEAFDALGGVGNETERNALAMEIFGRSAQDLNPLIAAGSAELENLAQQAREQGAVMSGEAVAGLDQFGDGMTQLKTSIMATIGQAFAKIMPIVQPILDMILKAPGPVKVIIGVIAAVGAALVVLMPILAAFATVQWAALAPMLAAAAPILAVVAAIGALVAIVIACIKYHEQIKAALIVAWEAIKSAMLAAWDAIKAAAEAVWGALAAFFTAIWDGVKAAWEAVWNAIEAFFGAIWGGIEKVFDAAWSMIKLHPIVAAIMWLKGNYAVAWEAIKSAFEAAWEAIQSAFDAAWEALKKAWNTMIAWVRRIPGWIKDVFLGAVGWLVDAGKDIITGLWDGIKNIWRLVTGWLGGVGGWAKNAVGDLGRILYDAGKAILQGLWDGAKAIWDRVAGWFKGVAGKVGGFFADILGIGSPSKVMFDIGRFTMEGFAEGLKATIPEVQRAMGAAARVPADAAAAASGPTTTTSSTTYNQQRQIIIPVSGNDGLALGRQIATILGGLD